MANFSLRAKSLIALAIACVLVLLPASWLGWLALRADHPESAGLGLIEIARRASAPLQATLSELSSNRAFFSLSVVI